MRPGLNSSSCSSRSWAALRGAHDVSARRESGWLIRVAWPCPWCSIACARRAAVGASNSARKVSAEGRSVEAAL